MSVPHADDLARICFDKFDSIPKTGKPILGKEWTVLCCIVKYHHEKMEVVSLGTGTKCIGRSSMSGKGDTLNDSHAEVICRRGFLRYLYEEINQSKNSNSICSFNIIKKKFEISSDVSFHFFTTHSPCGDASIYSIVRPTAPKKTKLEQYVDSNSIGNCLCPIENFTGAKLFHENSEEDPMLQSIGRIRTKPGRGEPTLSVSCSDKLAKWNILGLQGALLYSLIEKPIYIRSLTFGDQTFCDVEATKRAIWKRFETISSISTNSFFINRPLIQISQNTAFKYRKEPNLVPAPCSIVWCTRIHCEVAIGSCGKRLGITKKQANVIKNRLKISKIELFREYLGILKEFNIFVSDTNFDLIRYIDAKNNSTEYQNFWQYLKESYFPLWTSKPQDLNFFTID